MNASPARFNLIAAPFTPFDRAGEVDYPTIAKQAAKLAGDGVSGAFVCGTTGEGMSMTQEERKAIAEAWCGTGQPLEIFVHVGHASAREARRLAQHAETISCHAIAVIGPTFFTPSSREALVDFCAEIAEGTSRPFYYYHIPSMMRVPFKASELIPLFAERVPTFAGIKFTHNDLADFAVCTKLAGDQYKMLFGRDEMLLQGMQGGAVGAVGSTYNYAAPIYHKLWEAFRAGDTVLAEKWQASATRFIDIFLKYGGLEAGKAILAMCGVDCGTTRLPLSPLSPAACESLRQELTASGFFDDVR